MTSLFNNNFLFGFLLARDRKDPNERLSVGLQASQFPPNNPLGLVMLKKQVDTLEEVEAKHNALETELEELKKRNGKPAPGNGNADRIAKLERRIAALNRERDLLTQQLELCRTTRDQHENDLSGCKADLKQKEDSIKDLDRCLTKVKIATVGDRRFRLVPPLSEIEGLDDENIVNKINVSVADLLRRINELTNPADQ